MLVRVAGPNPYGYPSLRIHRHHPGPTLATAENREGIPGRDLVYGPIKVSYGYGASLGQSPAGRLTTLARATVWPLDGRGRDVRLAEGGFDPGEYAAWARRAASSARSSGSASRSLSRSAASLRR